MLDAILISHPEHFVLSGTLRLGISDHALIYIVRKHLSYKPHVAIMLKNVYAKIPALRRIKHLVLSDVMIFLYKAFVLRHLEYCSPLLLGIS